MHSYDPLPDVLVAAQEALARPMGLAPLRLRKGRCTCALQRERDVVSVQLCARHRDALRPLFGVFEEAGWHGVPARDEAYLERMHPRALVLWSGQAKHLLVERVVVAVLVLRSRGARGVDWRALLTDVFRVREVREAVSALFELAGYPGFVDGVRVRGHVDARHPVLAWARVHYARGQA